jgi:hypothetical protein
LTGVAAANPKIYHDMICFCGLIAPPAGIFCTAAHNEKLWFNGTFSIFRNADVGQ